MKGKFNLIKLLFISASVMVLCSCSKPKPAQEPAIKVKAFSVAAGQEGRLYYSGSVEAGESINLSFLTVGTAAQINVREGDKVTKGQLLAKLDCASNQNSLQIMQAKAQQAHDAYNRFEPMYKNGNLPEIKMVEINTNVTQADLAVKLAQKSVDDCSIIAPANGMISYRNIENGDNVIPGKAVLKLVTLGNVYALISVPEKEIHQIYKGQKAQVQLSSQDGPMLSGVVADVGVSADILARTYGVRIKLNNSSSLLPGMLCNVYLTPKKNTENGFIIPASALKLDGDGNQFVFVINEQTKIAKKQIVHTDGFRMGGVIVTDGLESGQVIVSEGAQKLEDNTRVEAEI